MNTMESVSKPHYAKGAHMRPELGFPGSRVIKIKGGKRGRRGLIEEANLQSGTWKVLFDDNVLEIVSPYEFDTEEMGARLLREQN